MTAVDVAPGPAAGTLLARLRSDEGHQALDAGCVEGLHAALTRAEAEDVRMLAVTGSGGSFCQGMDLTAAAAGEGDARRFQELLDRIARSPVVAVALVDGAATGGGVGLAAACDFVYASERSTFTLPELRLGLLPYVVVPYLVRRVGFQPAYAMTLSTQPVVAAEARRTGLVDATADDPTRLLARLAVRLAGVDGAAVAAAKSWFEAMSVVTDTTRAAAPAALEERLADPGLRAFLAGHATTDGGVR